MRKIHCFTTALLLLISSSAWCLDPMAPRSERGQGRIFVHTPQPENDTVTITNQKDSSRLWNTKSDMTLDVPVGDYQVTVKMQDYSYTQNVRVDSTETSFIVVPGFGNLKVNSLNASDKVTVTNERTGQVVATFNASETKVLPRGRYSVRVEVPQKLPAVKEKVWVVTNTTRVLDVKP